MHDTDKPMMDQPKELYTSEELLRGFNREKPMSYLDTWDFKVFRQFVIDKRDAPISLHVRRAQAEHDSFVSDALRRYLLTRTRLVGIMGGHNLPRSDRHDSAYVAVARLAQSLAKEGFLVVTGGGPGAMEAAHLGVAFCNSGSDRFEAALKQISSVPTLPNLDGILNPDGTLANGRERDVKEAHHWLSAALEAKALAAEPMGSSLAIPTWLYGEEPTTPFATRYAKYFQNSIREEALITNARTGVIYAQGGGGTLREVFEDMERNYYAKTTQGFTPMIFFDPDQFWQKDAQFDQNGQMKIPGIKIDDAIMKIVRFGRARNGDGSACLEKIRFTTDIQEILTILGRHMPVAEAQMHALLGKSAAPAN